MSVLHAVIDIVSGVENIDPSLIFRVVTSAPTTGSERKTSLEMRLGCRSEKSGENSWIWIQENLRSLDSQK